MSTLATGIYKKLTYKKQASQGTIATGGAATGQAMRRVTSTLNLKKPLYASQEINPSQQRRGGRHGVWSVEGAINGELSVSTHRDFMESLLRAPSAAGGSSALSDITTADTGTNIGTLTTAGGNFITDGHKVGDIVVMSGYTVATANNAKKMVIAALTTTVMTVVPLDGSEVIAKASGDAITIALAGEKIIIPQDSHTRDYYTFEHAFTDITQSEQYYDCVINNAAVKLPPTGMAGIDFGVMGLNYQEGTSAWFTSPTAASTGKLLAAVNGVMLVNGVKYGVITNLEVNINGNYTAPGGVVGSNIDPDIFPGAIDVGGSMTVLFENATLRSLFTNETHFTIVGVFTTAKTPTADAIGIVMTDCLSSGADKDDGEKGLSLTMPFTAYENTAGGAATAYDMTTLSWQDTTYS